jgi:hypothetical protein
MLGAIGGDVSGSVYEARRIKTTDFELLAPDAHFTDDTVLTVAIADALPGDCGDSENLSSARLPLRSFQQRKHPIGIASWRSLRTPSTGTSNRPSVDRGSPMGQTLPASGVASTAHAVHWRYSPKFPPCARLCAQEPQAHVFVEVRVFAAVHS